MDDILQTEEEFHLPSGKTINLSDNFIFVLPNATVTYNNEVSIDDYLWIYVSLVIVIIGIFGNTMTVLVMRRKNLCQTTISVYMRLMAVADTIAVITGILPEWLRAMKLVELRMVNVWFCRLEKFLFFTSADTAIWILVLFTCDRFIAVVFPLKKRSISSPKKAAFGCAVIFVCMILKNIHLFWTRGTVYGQHGELISKCDNPEPYKYFHTFIRPWLAFILISVIPFISLFIFNCLIVRALLLSRRDNAVQSTCDKNFRQTIMLCLSASFTFLVCMTPSIVLLIGKPYWKADRQNEAYDISKAVSNQLSYLNHSINFFLYCMAGASFRNELRKMLSPNEKNSGSSSSKCLQQTNCKRTSDVSQTVSTVVHNK